MSSVFKNKRGSWIDLFFIVVVMFGVAVVSLIGWKIFGEVNTEFQSKLTYQEGKDIMQENHDRYVGTFDGLFLFVFFGSFLATMVGVLFIDTHPAFFFLSMILLVIMCIVAAVLANAYAELETNAALASEAADFTYIPFIMQYYVHIIIFMVCAISIAMYAKSRMT